MHLQAGPLEGQGGLLSRSSLDGVHRKLAAEDEGGEWCPMHGYTGFNLVGDRAKISCRVRAPLDGGEERAECCR